MEQTEKEIDDIIRWALENKYKQSVSDSNFSNLLEIKIKRYAHHYHEMKEREKNKITELCAHPKNERKYYQDSISFYCTKCKHSIC